MADSHVRTCYASLKLQVVQKRRTGEINTVLRVERIRFPDGNDSQG